MTNVSLVARNGDIGLLPRDDLLRGARAIAQFLLNDPAQKRAIYHLIEHKRLPAFRLGRRIYARKSSLTMWIEKLEAEQNAGASSYQVAG